MTLHPLFRDLGEVRVVDKRRAALGWCAFVVGSRPFYVYALLGQGVSMLG